MRYLIFSILSYLFTAWMIGGPMLEFITNFQFLLIMFLPIVFMYVGSDLAGNDDKGCKILGFLLITTCVFFYIGFILVSPLRNLIFNQCGINPEHFSEVDIPFWKWCVILPVEALMYILIIGTAEGEDGEEEQENNKNEVSSVEDNEE